MIQLILLGSAFGIAAGGRPVAMKCIAIVLTAILLVGLVAPQPAYAQGGLLTGITGILNGLNSATTALQNFINNVMRPMLTIAAGNRLNDCIAVTTKMTKIPQTTACH